MIWEQYGPFAIGEFDNIPYVNSVRYNVTIYKKNYNFRYNPITGYTDPVISMTFAKDPVVIRTLNDDVFGIKGTEATLNILNKNGTLPLATFFSEEEDTFKIKVTATYLDSGSVSQTKTVFEGFLVQEDSAEILTDITHEIRLTFTDNLGTLKNLPFGDAVKLSPTSAANLRSFTANLSVGLEGTTFSSYIQLNTFPTQGNPIVGDYVVLNDSPIGDAAYTIIKIEDIGAVRRVYVREKVLPFTNVNVNITYITGNNPYGRLKLSEIIRICLQGTNLLLNFKFGNQAYAQTLTQSIPYPLDLQIDGRTFLSGEDNWKSCYDVLQQICMRFQCALYQSDGVWFLTRWNELRYQNNEIIHTNYNQYLANQFNDNQYAPNSIGQVEAGMEESILRPYNFYAEQFQYTNPFSLLYNSTLNTLGPKKREVTINYQVGDQFVSAQLKEYEAVDFTLNPSFTGQYDVRIAVIISNVDKQELDRYLLIRAIGSQSVGNNLILCTPFEVDANDELIISFSYKVSQANTNPSGLENVFRIYSKINGVFNDNQVLSDTKITVSQEEYFKWIDEPTASSNYFFDYVNTPNGESQNEWRAVTIRTRPCRKSKVEIQLGHYDRDNVANSSTFYKNFKIEVKNKSNNNAYLKGQQHKGYINRVVKNNDITDINIDSSVSNTVMGTLLTSATTNLVQDKIYTFRDGVSSWQGRLGELMTKQMMDWRYVQRVKLEGKLLGIYKTSFEWLTLHQALIFSIKSGKYFIFGKAVYNLKEDTIDATLYEMWKDGEAVGAAGVETNTLLDYDFKFLY